MTMIPGGISGSGHRVARMLVPVVALSIAAVAIPPDMAAAGQISQAKCRQIKLKATTKLGAATNKILMQADAEQAAGGPTPGPSTQLQAKLVGVVERFLKVWKKADEKSGGCEGDAMAALHWSYLRQSLMQICVETSGPCRCSPECLDSNGHAVDLPFPPEYFMDSDYTCEIILSSYTCPQNTQRHAKCEGTTQEDCLCSIQCYTGGPPAIRLESALACIHRALDYCGSSSSIKQVDCPLE